MLIEKPVFTPQQAMHSCSGGEFMTDARLATAAWPIASPRRTFNKSCRPVRVSDNYPKDHTQKYF